VKKPAGDGIRHGAGFPAAVLPSGGCLGAAAAGGRAATVPGGPGRPASVDLARGTNGWFARFLWATGDERLRKTGGHGTDWLGRGVVAGAGPRLGGRIPNRLGRTNPGASGWGTNIGRSVLADWRLREGRAECVALPGDSAPRSVRVLTQRLGEGPGGFVIELTFRANGNHPVAAGISVGEGTGGWAVGCGLDAKVFQGTLSPTAPVPLAGARRLRIERDRGGRRGDRPGHAVRRSGCQAE